MKVTIGCFCQSLCQTKTNSPHLPRQECPTSTLIQPPLTFKTSPKYLNCKILHQGVTIKSIHCFTCYFNFQTFVALLENKSQEPITACAKHYKGL